MNFATIPVSLRVFRTAAILLFPSFTDCVRYLQEPRKIFIFLFGKVAVGLRIDFKDSSRAIDRSDSSAFLGVK
jgi:hypothetical protein